MKRISILLLVIVTALVSCKKVPEVNKEYVDVERDLITVGTTTATIQCDYEYIATLKKAYLYYGEGEDATDMNVAEMSVVQKTLYVELASLKENTTYSYYYEFVNGFNSMKSAVKAFKTEASPTTVTLPTVVTAEVTEITANSAKGGGEVTNDGGAEVTERGICWSTNANPTLNDNHVASGTGTGSFTAMMENLEANTIYHVRAYAINEKGTAYGLDREFVTSGGGNGVPEGAINGLFTINADGDQVYFSQGNLQYQASTNTWRFAENQWNYVGTQIPHWYYGVWGGNVEGSDNYYLSESYEGWIDLFGWGTSGYNHGANQYQPWSEGGSIVDYFPYGNNNNNLYDYSGQADWGYNAISNGGNAENIWRTLRQEEWDYIVFRRHTASELRFAKANVNGVNGLIIFPDQWDDTSHSMDSVNYASANFDNNVINLTEWETMQLNGAVFLPAGGHRDCPIGMSHINSDALHGVYWSSTTVINSNYAYCLGFSYAGLLSDGIYNYWFGLSVRLVHNANP